MYVAGWIKRGPSGVIGTNKKDAHDTVLALLEDVRRGRIAAPNGATLPDATCALLAKRKPDVVSFEGWRDIDAAEVRRGKPLGRPGVKLETVAEMIDTARGNSGLVTDSR